MTLARAVSSAGWLIVCTAAVSCAAVFEYPESEPEQSAVHCADGSDNDLDGKTDCEDAECERFCAEHSEESCHDGTDNDQNDKTDCQDSACAAFCPESDAVTCSDAIDNDSDGEIDCRDSDCDGFCPEDNPSDCNDQRDNDGDGLADAADPRCWLHAPPRVQRCAQAHGVELVETFDTLNAGASWIFSEWTTFGSDESSPGLDVFRTANHSAGSVGPREDGAQMFAFNTTQSATLDNANLGGLVRTWQFSGTWQHFELSFDASLPLGAILRVGIVPAALAPPFEPTLPGAEDALLALTLDTASASPAISLDINGARVSAALPVTRALCAGGLASCNHEDMSKVRLVLDDDGFHATLEQANGEKAELRAPPPNDLSLPPSRLVFWAGTTTSGAFGLLDDVYLRVAPDYPCGVAVPQIPGHACESSAGQDAFGRVVSVARNSNGDYCALVSVNRDEPAPTRARWTAWTSRDGDVWSAVPPTDAAALELPGNATLVGAGIAHDDAGFHVAVAYREAQTTTLGLADGPDCGAWGTLQPGPSLFADAEAPSYVVDSERHAVYFTRPPTDETQRTLWRVTRATDATHWTDPELLAELPANVANPVSLERAGERDLVLVHPTTLSGGTPGVGLLVGTPDARTWRSVAPSPLLDIPKLPQNYGGSLAFDEEGVLAAALEWDASGGFLLYGAASPSGLNTSETKAPPWPSKVAVGSARLTRAGADLPAPSDRHGQRCGDDTCDTGEACATCPEDCACNGPVLVSDAFRRDASWQVLSRDPFPARASYVDVDHAALHWATGRATWSVLPLGRSIVGDFELSFDFVGEYVDPGVREPCSVHVGLAATAEPETPADVDAIAAGVFARFTYAQGQCFWQYASTPLVQSDAARFTSPVAESVNPDRCEVTDYYWPVESPRRVVLRREDNHVSLALTREDECGLTAQTVEYSGALPPLSALAVGFGGGAFEACPDSQGYGTITNLSLRLLDDPERCRDGTARCGTASEQASCVDTQRSGEHCGACDHACAENEVCAGGRCACSGRTGVRTCEGTCVDTLSDVANCGACGNTCQRTCLAGVCDAVTGECDAPIAWREDIGPIALNFTKQKPTLSVLCRGTPAVNNLLVYEWTPAESGVATIAVHQTLGLSVMFFSITADPECSAGNWIACGRGGAGDPEIPIVLPVVGGTTYRVAVGLASGEPTVGADLSIQVEP